MSGTDGAEPEPGNRPEPKPERVPELATTGVKTPPNQRR